MGRQSRKMKKMDARSDKAWEGAMNDLLGNDGTSPTPQAGGDVWRVHVARVVRAGPEADSKKLGTIKKGGLVEVQETRSTVKNGNAERRLRVKQAGGELNAISGWVSVRARAPCQPHLLHRSSPVLRLDVLGATAAG